jgi:hypothetical protein
MPVLMCEDGQEKTVSERTAFDRLPDDADLGIIASRLLRNDRIHTQSRDGRPLQLELVQRWHKDMPFRRQSDLLATETVPATPPGYSWVGDCTVHLELGVMVHCKAPDEKSAYHLIEDTILGRETPRPDFTIHIPDESIEALLFRIDHMRLPTDLGAVGVQTHKLTEQPLLEDHT